MTCQELTQTLVESFNALADEVQNLIDRKTILEHKLRYAHEQYQYLADKYAPAIPAVSETLAKLQLPPEGSHPALLNSHLVPLPKRGSSSDNAQIALFIREGRKVASRLSSLTDESKPSTDSSKGLPSTTDMTTLSATVLEQDFTVQGRKGQLKCPFSAPATAAGGDKDKEPPGDGNPNAGAPDAPVQSQDATPHHGDDPICAAMVDEAASQGAASGAAAAKCPIRFLDQHSAEEIAHYVETHKHEIPRSHEVCIERYQRNEDQIRKLDAKYGSLVGMIADLSQLHKPMLPRPEKADDVDGASNRRVEDWAHEVSANRPDDPPEQGATSVSPPSRAMNADVGHGDDEDGRESHFDRALKEVRVGESPSRPWGISVPVYGSATLHSGNDERPVSPPPAPVHMPPRVSEPKTPRSGAAGKAGPSKCPFDHTKLQGMMSSPFHKTEGADRDSRRPSASGISAVGFTPHRAMPRAPSSVVLPKQAPPESSAPGYSSAPRPAFINPPSVSKPGQPATAPQMLFTGPVFIGYPMEQAIEFMQHFQNNQ
ncbi:hypothetical protein RB595_005832 [Gaeumannomyces hyphopodioides]